MRRNLNLGILAHVDAGKTSLTERLLYDAGVIDRIGSVDDGSTQTDSLELERRRGITIKAAVVSFELGDLTVNLIDTPGHPDFIAEVERVLGVLDGVVLVVSAVEGVQSQTRVLMRTLRRLGLPTLLFVNKIDRAGADTRACFEQLRTTLSPSLVALGRVLDEGTEAARFIPYESTDPDLRDQLLELLAEHQDSLLAEYVSTGRTPAGTRLRRALAEQTTAGLVHPVYFGSAITGAGVAALGAGITGWLPPADRDPAAELHAQVFKVDRSPAGERRAYVRVRRGTVRTRDVLALPDDRTERVTGVAVFERGAAEPASALEAGRIGRLSGLHTVRVGDWLGTPGADGARQFPPPSLETVVLANHPSDKGRLHSALSQLAEQDPLIDLRQDDLRQEIYLSLYGEVQKEVIQTTLAEQFGVEVSFRPTTPICIERPAGSGTAVEFKDAEDNPFLATIGLRIEPGPIGSGLQYQLEVELGSMPFAFMRAVQDTVGLALRQGLRGWPVTDCRVSLTHSGYFPRQSHMGAKFDKSMSSTAGDFRHLTPLVLLTALRRAGTVVAEPIHSFELDLPADTIGAVLSALARCSAIPLAQREIRDGYRLDGELPAARVHELQQALPALTHGRGLLSTEFARFAPVTGAVPERARTDHNPLDRKEYLLHVERQV